MAKNTTKKTKSEIVEDPIVATNDVDIEDETVESVSKKTSKATTTATKKANKKYAPNDLIECRSVTGGELILIGPKTQLQYTWADYNDVSWVEFQDLQALQSRRSGFLVKPRFIIEDDELVEQWGSMLKPIYDKVIRQNIEDFFKLPLNSFKARLNVMPVGLKDAIKAKAVQMIQNDELYDVRKVREIDAAWGTDFVEMFLK